MKSIRKGRVTLNNSYAIDKKEENFGLKNLFIDLKDYKKGIEDLDNIRPKKTFA